MLKTNITIKDAMRSIGLSPRHEKHIYASLLDLGSTTAPRALRGYRRDPVSGFKWRREFEFIIKHRYGILVSEIVNSLVTLETKLNTLKLGCSPEDQIRSTFTLATGRMISDVGVDMKTRTIKSCLPISFFD
jgi:hypothetical protein